MIRAYEIKDLELALERGGTGPFGYKCQPGHMIAWDESHTTPKSPNRFSETYTQLGMIMWVSWNHVGLLWSKDEPWALAGFAISSVEITEDDFKLRRRRLL